MSARRFGFFRLDGKAERTAQGFLRVPGRFRRTGVLLYRNPDGTTRRELVPPDELFRADSLATLRSASVTDQHPFVRVTPKNARQLTVGHVEDVRQDGTYLAGAAVVTDETVIAKAEGGKSRECSCGYALRVDATPGRWDASTGEYGPHVTKGEPYDLVQRDIVYNHLALVPEGRAGSDVRLQLDALDDLGADDAVELREDGTDQLSLTLPNRVDRASKSSGSPSTEKPKMETISIRIDGVDYDVAKSAAPHITKALADRDARIGALQAEGQKLQGRLDGVDAELKTAKADLAKATDVAVIQQRVDARVKLEATALRFLGKQERQDGKGQFEGQSDREIKIAVITKVDKAFRADANVADAYLDGRFDHIVGTHQERGDKDEVRKAINSPVTTDAQKRDDNKQPQLAPWERPLAVSTQS